jgi:hypothetical protein
MSNPLNLKSGQKYLVVKPFTDYDQLGHPVGETWTFIETNFVPYHDGLTLHVSQNENTIVYRLHWTKEDQGDIIENFEDYVTPTK